MTGLLVALLLLAGVLGLPLFLVLSGIAMVSFTAIDVGLSSVVIEMLRLAGSPLLVAIPVFTFAGAVFAEGGASGRLVALSREWLGWLPGGMAVVALLTCALFTAFTGASGVTIVAVGGLLLPALARSGYPERYSLGLLTTSGSLGLLFPPSLPMIIYAYVAGVAVDDLFIAGVVPGLLLVALLAIHGARRAGVAQVTRSPFRWDRALRALREAAWEIPLPFVVLGGIYSGRVTVTEAATLTAAYAIVVEAGIYRDVPLRRLPALAGESMVLVAGILAILAAAFGLTNYLIDAEVPMRLLEWMQGAFTSRIMFLLALNLFLLIVGSLMDIFSALIVVVPLIVPVAEGYGVSLVHLGIIFLANLEIGYSTPPIGLNLFIASYRFGRSVVELYRASLPFLGILLIALALITYVPQLSLFLLSVIRGGG
ncbi:MAG: TRAP transporter large permease subunit [Gemmatimonadota bacterium]|nr:TRAP transporter large permease subunit [Gemmatimonadota bacterium]MDP6802971.1 TRAP transporter large permease subunit [Gemmatimonadota bacterium]MDP7032711.1 TRAP transporter large permease subunit [Gemmatimonadota bacterium]